MNRIGKILMIISGVIVLTVISVLPAFALTASNGSNVFYFYSPGTYSTRYNFYYGNHPAVPTPPKTNPPAPSPAPVPSPMPQVPPAPAPANGLTGEESKMVNLVNQERMNQGIKPFAVNMQLVTLARKKSQDMVDKNYFSHTSPTYGSPFDMMKNAGVSFKTAGENIAGAATTESAHQNLMNSPGHRANILNTSFNQIGIGIAPGSVYGNIFTQMFIGI